MPIARTPIVDDDGTGTTGTVIDNAWKQQLYDQIDALVLGNNAEQISTSAGGNIALGNYFLHVVLMNNAGAVQVTGFTGGAGSNKPGERVIVMNRGGGVVTFPHAGAGGLYNMATSAPTPIALYGVAEYVRANGVWVLTAHEQGAWIAAPYSATNYQGFGSMTWTVEAGDLVQSKYLLRGKTLTHRFTILTASIGGTVDIGLKILNAAYGGFVSTSANVFEALAYCYDAGATSAYIRTSGTTTSLEILKSSGANWTAGANLNYAYGGLTFDVN